MKQHLLTSFSALTSGLEVVETKEEADSMVVSGFSNSSYFGILALRPEDGAELWRQELEAKPLKHDCNLVDVNNDGLKDCIVVGERGMLAAIDPQTGKMHFPFYIFSSNSRQIEISQFLSRNQNKNKNWSADWSVRNLRGENNHHKSF